MNCTKCGQPVANDDRVWREIIAWEGPKGGATIAMRKRTGALMHDYCMVQVKHGLPERSLLDE